ncbi:hypothetical protein EDC04DRAFT_2603376 [Pisolithus marmoratus]|nr:hypothetical protein EDC04DRAFT_2603376 [Pisolithus marmoratus]
MSQYATKCSDALFKMLEKGKLSLHSNLLNAKNSDVRGEEHDTNPSCNTSVVMIGQMLARCIQVTQSLEHSLLRFILPCHEAKFSTLSQTQDMFYLAHCCHYLPLRLVLYPLHLNADSEPMGTPSSSPNCYSHALQDGDLFIHSHNHGCQAWMWGESGWTPVQEAGSGEPSWVTRKTMAMYRAKNRKCRP